MINRAQAEREFLSMTQDMATGEQLKLDGLRRVTKKHARELELAQHAARQAYRSKARPVSIEDVRELFRIMNIPWTLGNSAGAVFRKEEWEWTGAMKATRKEAHARLISTWRLKEPRSGAQEGSSKGFR